MNTEILTCMVFHGTASQACIDYRLALDLTIYAAAFAIGAAVYLASRRA